MLARQKRLIEIIRDELIKCQSYANRYKTSVSAAVADNKLYDSLKENPENIITTTKEEIKNIVDLFNLTKKEQSIMVHHIEIAKSIMEMNKEDGTTIEVEESQKESLEDFIRNLEALNKVREKSLPIEEPEYQETVVRISNLDYLLSLLEDEENTQPIDNMHFIKEILAKSNIEQYEIREILYSLMKYNREIYLTRKRTDILTKHLGEPLQEKDVKDIFKKYGYDFSELQLKYQDSILRYGELSNINDVFDCLKGFEYPKLDEKRDGAIIFSLVVGATFESINNATIHASNKDFMPKHLLQIPNALVRQRKDKTIYRKLKQTDENKVSINLAQLEKDPEFIPENELALELLNGKSIDFIKNIEYLEDNGFDIKYIFDRCKQLLIIDNKKLANNIATLEGYSLPLDCSKTKLTNQTFAALLSDNIADLADQFIEIHPLGYKYIRDNQSCLNDYNDALDVVFYNIYESQKPYIGKNGKPTITNAFKEIKSGSQIIIQLCDEITRKCKKYRNIPYKEITNVNKVEKTDTYIHSFTNADEYKTIIKNSYFDIPEDIFENIYIQSLEKYTSKNNPLAYNFDGIRISKIKVLRIFGALLKKDIAPSHDSLMYSIVYNTILNERAFSKINNIISKEIEVL